jgi:hypothetical protein
LDPPELIAGQPLGVIREHSQVREAGADPPERLVRHGVIYIHLYIYARVA